jgi:nicotinamidase-related amidase
MIMKNHRPDPARLAIVIVDMQEKLLPAMADGAAILRQHGILIQGAQALKLPIIATEQYPKGLGPTVPELKPLLPAGTTWEKTSFSCFGSAPFAEFFRSGAVNQLVVAGIETHVCVQQTVLDALERGLEVFILADAVGSRSPANRETALALMRQAGAIVTSTESFLFDCLRDASHPEFRTISRLVR